MNIIISAFRKNIIYQFFYAFIISTTLITFSCNSDKSNFERNYNNPKDSILTLIECAKEKSQTEEIRLNALKRATSIAMSGDIDSTKLRYLFKVIDLFYALKSDSLFLSTNEKAYELAKEKSNYKYIAEYHWNKGNWFNSQELLDSSFYHYQKAKKIYNHINHDYFGAKMDYNLSFIQFRVRNYIQSEKLAISAIQRFKKLEKNHNLYLCYNRLLLIDKELKNYDSALRRYKLAIKYLKKSGPSEFQKEKLLNNLSLVYQKQKDYPKAIAALDQALQTNDLKSKNLNLYIKLIDNRAYSRFLNGEEEGVLDDFLQSLYLRDSISNEAGVGISSMHLSAYYLKKRDSAKALEKAEQAHTIARDFGFNRDVLSSLVLLSKTDPANATQYMSEYITLNDSLLLEERRIRDKFTKIQFETEGYIAANETLKKKNVWISLSSVLGIGSLTLLFFGYRQRLKNQSLVLHQEHQRANEEIYRLMLRQQTREEEGRIQERVRISEELHDGALARLFSIRIGLGFLELSGNDKDSLQYETFMQELQKVEKDIKDLSRDLKDDELSSKKDFPKLLSELLHQQHSLSQFSCELIQDSSIAWNRVDEKIKINLFRITQESICNIMKYADCSHVKVYLKRKQRFVVLKIVDNGEGFDTNKKHKGIGLRNMRSRARSVGADFKLSSKKGKGTSIKVRIPTNILYHEEKP